jgi:hypothetical protein
MAIAIRVAASGFHTVAVALLLPVVGTLLPMLSGKIKWNMVKRHSGVMVGATAGRL